MEPKLKVLLFRACQAAIWSDEIMSQPERRLLSSMIEEIADTDEERRSLHDHALEDIKQELVLRDVAELDAKSQRHVFEECLSVIRVDREVNSLELRFLRRLGRVCGIGFFMFYWRIFQMWFHRDVKLIAWKKILAWAVFLAFCAVIASLPDKKRPYPKERPSGLGIELIGVESGPRDTPMKDDANWVYRLVRDSVYKVLVYEDGEQESSGSGSILGTDSAGNVYILTNKHVIYNEKKGGLRSTFRIQSHDNKQFDAFLDFYSRGFDLAILRVEGLSDPPPALFLSLRSTVEVGQRVYALGNPLGMRHVFTTGIISALKPNGIRTDTAIASGSSGGPLIDGYGRVCGVVTSGRGANYAFALYADVVLEALEERRLLQKIKTAKRSLSRPSAP